MIVQAVGDKLNSQIRRRSVAKIVVESRCRKTTRSDAQSSGRARAALENRQGLTARHGRRIAKRRRSSQSQIRRRAVEIRQKAIVENINLVQIKPAHQIFAARADIANFERQIAEKLALNAETVLLDFRHLQIRINRKNSSEVSSDGSRVVLQISSRRSDKGGRSDC